MFNDLARRLQIAGIRAELEDGQLAFHFAPPEGEVLKLARPQPHPWLSERLLEAVGVIPADRERRALPAREFARLAEANEQLKQHALQPGAGAAGARSGNPPAGCAEYFLCRLAAAGNAALQRDGSFSAGGR